MVLNDTYHEAWPRLFGIAYRMTGSVADAEDIVQEAWMRRLQQADGTVRSEIGWLIRTVSTITIDYLRRSRRNRGD